MFSKRFAKVPATTDGQVIVVKKPISPIATYVTSSAAILVGIILAGIGIALYMIEKGKLKDPSVANDIAHDKKYRDMAYGLVAGGGAAALAGLLAIVVELAKHCKKVTDVEQGLAASERTRLLVGTHSAPAIRAESAAAAAAVAPRSGASSPVSAGTTASTSPSDAAAPPPPPRSANSSPLQAASKFSRSGTPVPTSSVVVPAAAGSVQDQARSSSPRPSSY